MTLPVLNGCVCKGCSAQLAPTLLACPQCGALVYAGRLQQLAEAARDAAGHGDPPAALAAWREAIELLPRNSRQYGVISKKIEQLTSTGAKPAAPDAKHNQSAVGKATAGLGAIGLLLWKLKVAVLFLLTKGKLLLLGLTKASTFFSMLLSFGVYWSIWGWKFALGLVLSIYVHEMGHVVALLRYGFKASAPLFIPGVGAVIRLQQRVDNPREDAVIGLAGPNYGMLAALAALGLWAVFRHPVLLAIAGVGAWINLFNLLPVWTLDGGRAFHAMSRGERWIAAIAVGVGWAIARDSFMAILLAVVAIRALEKPSNPKGDRRAVAVYVGLVLALSTLSLVRQDPRGLSHGPTRARASLATSSAP